MVDEADAVGSGQTGEQGTDGRSTRSAHRSTRRNPIPDFNDAFAEIGRARRAAIFSLQRTATAAVPGEGPGNERQALWELTELARAEREGDYAWINAATLWALHSTLELTAQLPEGALDHIVQAAAGVIMENANLKAVRPKGNGAIRWEGPLATVGLGSPDDRPIPPGMDRALAELCILRDVLSHRSGRVDQQAADDWPSGALEVGSFVRISQSQVRRYSAAVGAYGAEISRRLLARFSVNVHLDLGRWEDHGFFV